METAHCANCSRKIPERRSANARRVGAIIRYCSKKCQNAAKQSRFRKRVPKTEQDRIHLRNLAAHGMIAEKLLHDPHVIEIAKDNLDRWVKNNGHSPAIDEWSRIIDSGDLHAIITAILRVDEEGMRLRSSSPFAGVLNEDERDLIFRATRQ